MTASPPTILLDRGTYAPCHNPKKHPGKAGKLLDAVHPTQQSPFHPLFSFSHPFIREIHNHIFGLCPLPLIPMLSLSGLPADFLIASCNEYDSNVAHDHHQVLLRLEYISSSRTRVQDRCNRTHCAIIWALAATIYEQCPPELLTPSSPTPDRPIPGSPFPPLLAIAPCPYPIY